MLLIALHRVTDMEVTYIYFILVAAIFGRIAYVDYKECAIYDRDSLVAFVIIFCYSLYQGNIKDALIGAGVGLAIGFLIFFTAYKLYGFEAFGLGDVLLLGILGLFFAQDFLSYLCISLTVSGFLVLVCIPFVGYERISRTEHRLHLYSYYGFPFLCWLVSHL